METWIEALTHEGISESYTRIRHKSGMTVCVFRKETTLTYGALGVLCGAVDSRFAIGDAEYSVPDGTAHFLEHKLFASEDGDALSRFAAIGASGDAYTTPDLTAYLFSATENEMGALAILLDFVFHPYFTKENVDTERAIIAQELRMYDDTPFQRGYYNTLGALYHTHPIKNNVGGTEESIADITPEVLYRLYNAFYHPENMVLTVAGNVTPEDVLSVCDAYIPCDFSPFATVRLFEKEQTTLRATHTADTADVSAPILYIGIKDNARFADRTARERHAAAVDILCDILFSKSSVLYNALYEKGLINGKFGFDYEWGETYAYLMLTAETDDPDATARTVLDTIQALRRTHDITDTQFEICRRVMYASAVTAFESSEEIALQALDDTIDGGEMLQSVDIMMSVKKDELFCVLDTLFDPDAVAIGVLSPKTNERKQSL